VDFSNDIAIAMVSFSMGFWFLLFLSFVFKLTVKSYCEKQRRMFPLAHTSINSSMLGGILSG